MARVLHPIVTSLAVAALLLAWGGCEEDDAAPGPVASTGAGGAADGGPAGGAAGDGGAGGACTADRCVELYERVEETLANDGAFTNPFTETELRVSVTAPAGRPLGSSFEWFGFYDGDGSGGQVGTRWRFRLLFDHPGRWTVEAGFFDPSTDTANGPSQQWSYDVASTALAGEHGHVYVDPGNWRRLRHADGTPWVPVVMQSSMLLDRDTTVATQWIDEHVSRGVDALAVRLHTEAWKLSGDSGKWHYLLDGARATAWPGDPDAPLDYSHTDDFDYTRFDVASWQHNEAAIEYALAQGVKLSIWFGVSGLNRQYWSYGPLDYPDDQTVGPLQDLAIKYFLARWAPFTNFWHWSIDSEYEEAGGGALERVRAYAARMAELNPWRTLLTTHVLSDWSPAAADELNLATLQRRVDDTNAGVVASRAFITDNDGFDRPVYNAEGIWAMSNPTRTRLATWAHIMAGGFAKIAHDSLPGGGHDSSSWGVTWSAINPRHQEDAAEAGAIATFLNRTPGVDISSGVPHHELVSLTGGNLALCLADPPNSYFIWLDQGGTATLDLTGAAGTFSVTRYAGTDLTTRTDLDDASGGALVALETTPDTGFGNDYLLLVQAQ